MLHPTLSGGTLGVLTGPAGGGLLLQIAYYDLPAQEPTAASLNTTWEGLAALLGRYTQHQCTGADCQAKRHGAAWSPVRIEHGAWREGEAIEAITALVLDLDDLSPEELDHTAKALESCGLAYIAHSTHSHTIDKACLRAVLPLGEPFERAEGQTLKAFAAAWQGVRSAVIAELGVKADPSCKDPSRIYYLPSGPYAPEDFVFASGDGGALDWRSVTPAAPSAAGGVAFSTPLHAVQPDEEPAPLDLDSVRSRLRRVRKRESQVLVKRVLKGQPLSDLNGRSNAVNQAASILAGAIPELGPDAALEILRPSILAMPMRTEEDGETPETFLEMARNCFERAKERSKSYREEQRERTTSILQALGVPDAEIMAAADPITAAQQELQTAPWADGLIWLPPDMLTGIRKLAPVPANVEHILTHAPEFEGVVRFNDLHKRVELIGGPFEDLDLTEPGAANALPAKLQVYLTRRYGLMLRVSEVRDQILPVALANRFNPVEDYLVSLKWDKVPRLRRMLPEIFHARTRSADGRDITAYIEAVGHHFMVSAVARALDPGCQVDTVLILESEKQGLGKTSSLRILGGDFYRSSRIDLRAKDALQVAGTSWLIELAELDSFNRAEASLAKGFFTDTKDSFRPPYGSAVEDWPRRCIFIGTTNHTDYLTDLENRRYWPVEILELVDLARLAAERNQLWAEALHCYRAGEEHHFSDALAALAAIETEDRRAPDSWEDRIEEWFLQQVPVRRPETITGYEIATKALSMAAERINRGVESRIGLSMRALGFKKRQETRAGRRVWVYVLPELIQKAAQRLPQASLLTAMSHKPAQA